MKSALLAVVLFIFCYFSTTYGLPVFPSHGPDNFFPNISKQCSGSVAQLEISSLNYTLAAAEYKANCTGGIKNQVVTEFKAKDKELTFNIDCTESSTVATNFENQCEDQNGKFCTMSSTVTFDTNVTTIDVGVVDLNNPFTSASISIKMFVCVPKNCSSTDLDNFDTDACDIVTPADGRFIQNWDCSVKVSCGSSAVIIIIIIIVVIVILLVIVVVVVMIMKRRRSEYTPIKTGEYH